MNQQDPQLSGLLRKWQDIEPRPAFAQDVLRRMRLATPAPGTAGEETGLRFLLRRWLPPALRPVALTAAAAFVGGVLFGLTATRPIADSAGERDAPVRFQILQPGTVSGNYLAFTQGGRP